MLDATQRVMQPDMTPGFRKQHLGQDMWGSDCGLIIQILQDFDRILLSVPQHMYQNKWKRGQSLSNGRTQAAVTPQGISLFL